VFYPSLPVFGVSFAFTVSDTTGSEIPCKALIAILSGTDIVPIVFVNPLYRNLDMTYFVEQERIKTGIKETPLQRSNVIKISALSSESHTFRKSSVSVITILLMRQFYRSGKKYVEMFRNLSTFKCK
jgi:hypothetical protein